MIPLNGEAWAAILELRERAKLFSGTEPSPDWYVFPRGEGQGPVAQPKNRPGPPVSVRPDPTRPMSTWRTAWRNLTKRAGLPGLRFHDLRHHAITELAESSASDQTIMAIAGHVSQKMLQHYSHVRLERKREALNALSEGDERVVTTQSTAQEHPRAPQVLNLVVDVTGIEPVTPCLQNKIFALRKPSRFSDHPDNKAFRFQSRMCAAVSGYVRMIIGSLQKSLQCFVPIFVP